MEQFTTLPPSITSSYSPPPVLRLLFPSPTPPHTNTHRPYPPSLSASCHLFCFDSFFFFLQIIEDCGRSVVVMWAREGFGGNKDQWGGTAEVKEEKGGRGNKNGGKTEVGTERDVFRDLGEGIWKGVKEKLTRKEGRDVKKRKWGDNGEDKAFI